MIKFIMVLCLFLGSCTTDYAKDITLLRADITNLNIELYRANEQIAKLQQQIMDQDYADKLCLKRANIVNGKIIEKARITDYLYDEDIREVHGVSWSCRVRVTNPYNETLDTVVLLMFRDKWIKF